MKLSRTKRTKGTQPQWVVEECQVTKPETLHSFMTWVGSPFGGPLVFGETRRVDAYIQNERVTWRTTVEIQPDNVSQSTFDLGGFPFALHITQASTASATAFLHFSHPPRWLCSMRKERTAKIPHQGTAFLSFSTDTIDEVRKEVESAKIQNDQIHS